MSTSPSSAASASMAPPSRTSRTRPSTRAPVARHGRRGGADAFGVAAGEQDAVVRVHAGGERFHERAAEALVGPRDEGGASSASCANGTCVADMSEANIEHTYHAVHACLATSPRPAFGCCARWRSRARSRPPRACLGYTQSAVSRQVAALEAVAGRRAVRAPARRRRPDARRRAAARAGGARARRARRGPPRRGRAGRGGRAGAPGDVRHRGGGARCPAPWRRCRATSSSPCARGRRPPSPGRCGPGRSTSRSSRRRRRSGRRTPRRPPSSSRRSPSASWSSASAPGTRSPARRAVEVGELAGQVWVASRSEAGESLLGVWPGLAERPDVRYVVRDWWAKLQLVAAGLAITTLAPVALDVLPDGVRAVAVRGEPQELRRAGPRPRAGPARRQSGRGRRRAGQRGEGLRPAARPQPRSRRRATWRSSAARRSSHAPPTDVIHEMASPSGAGVGR